MKKKLLLEYSIPRAFVLASVTFTSAAGYAGNSLFTQTRFYNKLVGNFPVLGSPYIRIPCYTVIGIATAALFTANFSTYHASIYRKWNHYKREKVTTIMSQLKEIETNTFAQRMTATWQLTKFHRAVGKRAQRTQLKKQNTEQKYFTEIQELELDHSENKEKKELFINEIATVRLRFDSEKKLAKIRKGTAKVYDQLLAEYPNDEQNFIDKFAQRYHFYESNNKQEEFKTELTTLITELKAGRSTSTHEIKYSPAATAFGAPEFKHRFLDRFSLYCLGATIKIARKASSRNLLKLEFDESKHGKNPYPKAFDDLLRKQTVLHAKIEDKSFNSNIKINKRAAFIDNRKQELRQLRQQLRRSFNAIDEHEKNYLPIYTHQLKVSKPQISENQLATSAYEIYDARKEAITKILKKHVLSEQMLEDTKLNQKITTLSQQIADTTDTIHNKKDLLEKEKLHAQTLALAQVLTFLQNEQRFRLANEREHKKIAINNSSDNVTIFLNERWNERLQTLQAEFAIEAVAIAEVRDFLKLSKRKCRPVYCLARRKCRDKVDSKLYVSRAEKNSGLVGKVVGTFGAGSNGVLLALGLITLFGTGLGTIPLLALAAIGIIAGTLSSWALTRPEAVKAFKAAGNLLLHPQKSWHNTSKKQKARAITTGIIACGAGGSSGSFAFVAALKVEHLLILVGLGWVFIPPVALIVASVIALSTFIVASSLYAPGIYSYPKERWHAMQQKRRGTTNPDHRPQGKWEKGAKYFAYAVATTATITAGLIAAVCLPLITAAIFPTAVVIALSVFGGICMATGIACIFGRKTIESLRRLGRKRDNRNSPDNENQVKITSNSTNDIHSGLSEIDNSNSTSQPLASSAGPHSFVTVFKKPDVTKAAHDSENKNNGDRTIFQN